MGLDHFRDRFRIHAIILTKDRPETLARCVATAVASLSPSDALTILDDSGGPTSYAMRQTVLRAAANSAAHVAHFRASDLHGLVAQAVEGCQLCWQTKTTARDIAPLRNLELLLSVACEAQTTLLVDDDLHSFDLKETHDYTTRLASVDQGAIVGAEIAGTTEQDTLTRLSDAMRVLQSAPDASYMELFRAQAMDVRHLGAPCEWVSAGYLAYRLPSANLFAFPPGFNEDWLWCLLQGATGRTQVVRSRQTVLHEPPIVRRSSRADVHFELLGDLVFDCLSQHVDGIAAFPEIVLQSLHGHTPDQSLLPAVRVEELLCQHHEIQRNAQHVCGLKTLESHGLSLLRDMLRSGELAIDGRPVLSAWCADALRKHRSFAATVRNAAVRRAVKRAIEEGTG
jgi:hypothetical protein